MSRRRDAKWLASTSSLLDEGIAPLWRKLDARERDAVARGFIGWSAARSPAREDDPFLWEQLELVRFLREQLETLTQQHGDLSHRFRILQQRMELAETETVRRELMLAFAASLGASAKQLRGDRVAMDRWLDADAVAERCDREQARVERRLRFCLERLGPLVQRLCAAQPEIAGVPTWTVLGLEASLSALLGFPGDPRIRESALTCLRVALAGLGPDAHAQMARSTVQYIYRSVLDPRQSVWLQAEALETLVQLAPGELQSIVERRLVDTDAGGDAMFFRHRLTGALASAAHLNPHHEAALRQLAADPAPFVRQGVASALPKLPWALALDEWEALANDPVGAVAGQALLQTAALCGAAHAEPSHRARIVDGFLAKLHAGTADFPLKVALRVAPLLLEELRQRDPDAADSLHARLERQLTTLHTSHPDTGLRRRAATAREALRPQSSPLPPTLGELPLHASTGGSSLRIADGDADPILAARRLLPLAERGFGFNLERGRRGWRLLRDWRWRPRLWRVLHEVRRPATDKRQNYPHMRGRVYPGLLHVPSACVAELSPTKVPGEPLHIAEEDGWRPWLPLLDQVLSALDQGWPAQPLRIVTVEGVTSVRVPEGLLARLRAKWRLSVCFADVAALRNWTSQSAFPAHAFIDALRESGIACEFEPHADRHGAPYPADPRVRRFFTTASMSWMLLPVREMADYFYSIYQNSLEHLLVFIAALGTLFFGQHLWLNHAFRRARASLPLVMGGWGTRGKSGTERLKAAVLSALGLRVVSKTTGCEAMFLFGHPNRALTEMFLFRPYDKATIWEQARLTRMAASLEADVFLWECMGLNPGYVRVLQHDWMRDDVSTITNCFPDHEDIQGPAGVDLPLVIREFIPRGGELYTSEENMQPYLAEQARALGTRCTEVDWLDVGLLTPDILARFPYQEHPANIALVARMFEGMGLRRDFALREMADRVVPDLGVLKSYPQARYEGRRIEFINGMSANERHGCLSNWVRTGMDRHHLDVDPGTWTATVVNNRADRVARSEVFASILVNDIGADRHFLIGGNLDGLQRFIHEAFDTFIATFDWQDTELGVAAHHAMADALLRRWRVTSSAGQADDRLRAACLGLGLEPDAGADGEAMLARLAEAMPEHHAALERQWRLDQADATRAGAIHAAIAQPDAHTAATVRQHLRTLFEARIVAVEDYGTPGNVLVQRILRTMPPGLSARVMGIQNIKGTGLDFVYRWQAWDIHSGHCRALSGHNTEAALAAAQALAASTELGVLEAEAVREAIASARLGHLGQTDILHSLLARIERNLDARLQEIDAYAQDTPRERNRAWAWILRSTERFLDAGDAVRRRRAANQVYRDLVNGRIAAARAAYELKRVNQRQKGGWWTG